MSDEQALLAAIGAHPAEDTPRLIYADWLDEHGRPDRAEFVRVQIEAANLRWNDPRRNELGERAKQLLEAHTEEWTEALRWLSPGGETEVLVSEPTADGWGGGVQLNWIDPEPTDMGDAPPWSSRCIDFYRGFPRRVYLEPLALANAPIANAIGPRPQLILTWEPHTRDRGWLEAVWPEVVRGLRSAHFSDWVFDTSYHYEFAWLPLLANTPDVARGVSGLLLEGAGADDRPEAELTDLYPLTPALRTLSLERCDWSLETVRRLGSCGLSKRMEHLSHQDAHPAGAVLRALAEVGEWPRLVSLNLEGFRDTGADVLQLIRKKTFPALRSLTFWGDGGTVEFFAALLSHPHLPRVERVEYHGRGNNKLRRLRDRSGGRFVCK